MLGHNVDLADFDIKINLFKVQGARSHVVHEVE